jgi:7-cyano-7-deazaguanine tRNA-ribosyltransferase
MRSIFEFRDADAAGRVGRLEVPRRDLTVETPALLPVVNPNVQTLPPERLAELGAEMLITNSYIIQRTDDLRERALSEGLHELLGFDGAIMTDSGSFQLAEYGEIDVTTEEILEFQHAIGADVGTPVDVPTPPEADRETVAADLEVTEDRLETAEAFDAGEMLVTAPIQGGLYPDLREGAARNAYETTLDVFPVGAVVPLLNDYRFGDVVEVVTAAKRELGADAPVHLFGAGHPMMFALAVAMGCDLFDSAAYAIYARDDRYLTVRGTEHLEDLSYLPCECPVCAPRDPDAIRSMDDETRHTHLAEHNLYVSFGELRRIKQAIRRGNLLELVEERARAHPAMLSGYRALLDHAEQLERSDPATKETFMSLSNESAGRPEVVRHRERVARLSVPDSLLLTEGPEIASLDYAASWSVVPPFGPVPPALAQTYPLNPEVPERTDRDAQLAAARTVAKLVEHDPDASVTLAHRGWHDDALAALPSGLELVDVS